MSSFFKRFNKKHYALLGTYVLGGASSYLIFALIRTLSLQKSISSAINLILSYPVIVKDSNPITVGKLSLGFILLILGYYLSKVLSEKISKKILPKFNLEIGAIAALHNLIFYALISFFTLFALHTANVPLTMFTVLGGALAIGVGFGSQNVLNNFISGIILQIERPIRVGDIVEVDGSKGVVNHIGARRTIISAGNGSVFVIPNSHLLEKKLQNKSLVDKKTKIELRAVVHYNSDINKIKSDVEGYLSSISEVIQYPAPKVLVSGYLDNGFITLTISFWITLDNLKHKAEIESSCYLIVQSVIKLNSQNNTNNIL